jgi:shikimate kinase
LASAGVTYAASIRQLLTIVGPIGAGKSSVAERVAERVRLTGLSAALADLDELAFAQRADLDLPELWRRAGVAHGALVHGWFAAGWTW